MTRHETSNLERLAHGQAIDKEAFLALLSLEEPAKT